MNLFKDEQIPSLRIGEIMLDLNLDRPRIPPYRHFHTPHRLGGRFPGSLNGNHPHLNGYDLFSGYRQTGETAHYLAVDRHLTRFGMIPMSGKSIQ